MRDMGHDYHDDVVAVLVDCIGLELLVLSQLLLLPSTGSVYIISMWPLLIPLLNIIEVLLAAPTSEGSKWLAGDWPRCIALMHKRL